MAALAAADATTGHPHHAVGVAVGILVLTTRALVFRLSGDRRLAVAAAAVLVASPMIVVHGASYLVYVPMLAMLTTLAATSVSAIQDGGRLGWMATGFVAALAFWLRPFDTLLVAGVILVWIIASERSAILPVVRSAAVPGLVGAAPVLLALGAVNNHITGNAFVFPLEVTDGINHFGFGERAVAGGVPSVDYSARVGLSSQIRNLTSFDRWAFGGVLGVLLALRGAWLHRRRSGTAILAMLAAVFPQLSRSPVPWSSHPSGQPSSTPSPTSSPATGARSPSLSRWTTPMPRRSAGTRNRSTGRPRDGELEVVLPGRTRRWWTLGPASEGKWLVWDNSRWFRIEPA